MRASAFAASFLLLCATAACDSDKKPDEKADGDKAADAKPAEGGTGGTGGAEADAPDEKPPAATTATPEQLERGKYLAEVVMNCRACHTPMGDNGPDLSKSYAGGLEFNDSSGTWRAPNISQDRKTGIGGWTDEEIITAVREGKRPTGEQMYPVMPYQYFASATDEDMVALVAYLRTVKGVENAVAGNTDLKLTKPDHKPANPEGPVPGDLASEGKYLVELAHCGDCHTPRNEDGSPDEAKAFSGGREFTALDFQGSGKVWSANITPHDETGIGKYTDDELMTAIVDLDKRDGTAIVGPMTFYVGAWSKLTHKDAKAIAAYLRSLPAVENKVEASTWKPPAP